MTGGDWRYVQSIKSDLTLRRYKIWLSTYNTLAETYNNATEKFPASFFKDISGAQTFPLFDLSE